MIQLDSVSKVYRSGGGEVRALDDLSLTIAEGEFVAVRGPSGCGKSTLLTLVGALALPTAGKVVVAGQEVSHLSSAERAVFRETHVGFVFQMFHLLSYLNVLQNVLLAAPAARQPQARDVANELLQQFGMSHRLTHRPGQLSTGERQRVAMARALLNGPRILLADEPTGNLDPENAQAVLDLIGKFHRDGGTVLLVTHDPSAAANAQRTIHLDSGRLQQTVAV